MELKIINLKEARHPLIDAKSVVPIDIEIGKNYFECKHCKTKNLLPIIKNQCIERTKIVYFGRLENNQKNIQLI